MPADVSAPVHASFPSDHLTIGAGVAIFHIATARCVVCYHSRDGGFFLPKGRRNANEDTNRAAEREGFEESGYRNRLLPLPMKHRQPQPDEGPVEFVTEPLWTQFLPLSTRSQYLLFWYAAETVSPEVEQSYTQAQEKGDETSASRIYRPPPSFPPSMTLRERIGQDTGVIVDGNGKTGTYEPVWHEGTGVDEEELLYKSYLLPIDEVRKLLKGTVMEDVVKRAWEGVQLRLEMEKETGQGT